VRHVDRSPVTGGGLGANPICVKLIGEVRYDQPLGARRAAVLTGFARSQMTAHSGALGSRQRCFDQQQVGAAPELHELLVGRAIGAVGDATATLADQLDGIGRGVVGNLVEADRERANLQLIGCVVLVDVERLLDQVIVSPATHHRAKNLPRADRREQLRARGIARARPPRDRNRLLTGGIAERVAERNEVEEVVGVQVADQHRVD